MSTTTAPHEPVPANSRTRRRWRTAGAALAVCALVGVAGGLGTPVGTVAGAAASHKTKNLASLLPASIRSAGVITNGSPQNNPPLIFLNASQQLTGIDFALAKALQKELGVKFNFVNTPFPAIIPGLESGHITTSLSVLSDTPTREQTVSFVDYVLDGVTFIGAYGNPQHIKSPAGFCGQSLGATQGAIEAKFISDLSTKYCTSKGKPAITPALYSTAADVLLALDSGRVVADVHPGAASQYIAKTSGKKYQLLLPGKLYLANYGGIGVAKGETQLAHALVVALRALQANGTYGKILKKYGLSRMALTRQQITVNAATTTPLTAAQKKIYLGSSPYITKS